MAETEEKLAGEEPADEASQEPKEKKKGGKLPVILALLLLLGGGGFFYMKVKARSSVKKVEIKLGEVVPLKEFLVNLQSPSTYARTEIALHLKEGYKKEDLDKSMSAVLEAVQMVLSSHSAGDVASLEGKMALKRELAAKLNSVLNEADEGGEHKADPPKAAEDAPPAHPSWDSDTGPILRVYLTSFATQ